MPTVIPIDDFSPIFVGDVGNPFSIYVAHKNGYMSLIGTTITMKLFNATTNTLKTCTGPWTIDPLDTGKASYQYQAGDVDTVGSWQIWIKILLGVNPIHVDDGTGNPKILVINALPTGV